MDNARNIISNIQQKENIKLALINDYLDKAHSNILTLLISGVVVCILLLAFFI